MAQAHRSAAFWFVYPNPGDSGEAVREHQARYGINNNVVLDTRHRLTQFVHATVTPEAAILVPDGKELREVYRGRIDDRYAGLGKERPQAMHHDLENALEAVLAGRPVPSVRRPSQSGARSWPLEGVPSAH